MAAVVVAAAVGSEVVEATLFKLRVSIVVY